MSYNPLNPNGQATAANSQPVVLPAAQITTLTPPTNTGYSTSAKQDTGNTSLASIDTKTPALGQAVAAASVPVILPAATITTLTPPAAITGFLTESDFDTKIGSLTETAPTTDTASSGLNGRLQRIAQRLTSLISALGSPFQAGGSIGNTTFASTVADGANTTLGAKADAKSTATDTTAVSVMSVLKQISASVQAPPTQAVTFTGSTDAATQTTLALAQTSLALIDDVVYTDDTSTHATGTSKGVGIMATATPTDTSVNANDIGMVAMTTDRRLLVDASGVAVPITDNSSSITVDYATTGSGNATGALRVELPTNGTGVIATVGAVTAITNALPAGTNAIGKLAANSGVDIGDVDVTSIAAGTNTIGGTYCVPNTSGGLSTFNATSSDGATALTSTAQAIKASAGQLFGWYLYNPNATAAFVQLYNTASASVTVGTTNPLFMLTVPAGAAANVMSDVGITFSNAGWSCAATSTAGGSGAPSTALDCVFFYK